MHTPHRNTQINYVSETALVHTYTNMCVYIYMCVYIIIIIIIIVVVVIIIITIIIVVIIIIIIIIITIIIIMGMDVQDQILNIMCVYQNMVYP